MIAGTDGGIQSTVTVAAIISLVIEIVDAIAARMTVIVDETEARMSVIAVIVAATEIDSRVLALANALANALATESGRVLVGIAPGHVPNEDGYLLISFNPPAKATATRSTSGREIIACARKRLAGGIRGRWEPLGPRTAGPRAVCRCLTTHES